MFKKLTIILALALLCNTAWAQNSYHGVQIVDERGVKVTDISSVEIYAPDTTTNAVIYSDRGRQNTITIPMTTGSTNTTLVDGFIEWFGPDGYDFSITDGTNIATNANHRTRTSSEGTLVFPSYLTSITTSQYLDAESITMGTSSDWVLNAGTTPDLLTWTPASDGAIFRIGANDAATNGDFRVQVGTDLGFYIDEGVPSFSWTGGAASINAGSNFNTTINTGSSTGTVTLGGSAAGALTLDTASTYTLSSDAAHSTTTTDASANITIDSTAGSVIIDGGEAIADAVTIVAGAGGIDITSAATFDIDITATGGRAIITGNEAVADSVVIVATGAAGGIDITSLADVDITTTGTTGEDISLNNDGGSVNLIASEAVTDAINIDATGVNGGIDLDTSNGPITINAVSTDAGDITIDAGDVLTLNHVDSLLFGGAAAETWVVEGTADEWELTYVHTDPVADVTYTFPTTNSGYVLVSSTTSFTGTGSMSTSHLWGGVHNNTGATGAIELEIPSAVVGMEFTFFTTVNSPVSLDPDGSDIILNHTNTAGDKITSAAVSGAWITLRAISTSAWAPISVSGAWTDGGA